MKVKNSDNPHYTGLWKKVNSLHDISYPLPISTFQINNVVLCKESFNNPRVLIFGDLAKCKIYEYSLDNTAVRPFQIFKNNEFSNKSKSNLYYYAVTEEVNKSVFIFGGIRLCKRKCQSFNNKLYRFSILKRTFLEVNIMNHNDQPAARVGASLTYVSFPFPHLLLFGGVTEGGKFKNDLWMFNILQLKWKLVETTGHIPPPMELHTAGIWGKYFFVIGGLTKEDSKYTTSDNIYWLDLEKAEWHRNSGNNLINRANHSMYFLQDEIMIYGGFQINKNNKQVRDMKFEGKNLIEFHEELLKVTKILSDMNIINIENLESERIEIDNSKNDIIPLTGQASFMFDNIYGAFGGTTYDKNNEVIENKNFYICEIGAPTSPLHPIPYNIDCSSFDLVWRESCKLSSLCMKRTYCVEIMKLTQDFDSLEGMQIVYKGSESKCHINKVYYDNTFVTSLHPDTNYKIRLYSYTKYNDFERYHFPEVIIKTAPCEIIELQDPSYYYYEEEQLFIFNWVGNSKKFPCIHTKYYLSALPIINNNNKYIMDINSSILYIGLEREISFTYEQLLKSLEQSRIFEQTKNHNEFCILFVLDQYNLIHEKPVRYDSKQVMAIFSNNKFEKFIHGEDIIDYLDKFDIEKAGDSNISGILSNSDYASGSSSETLNDSVRSTRSSRATRNSGRKRMKLSSSSQMYSSLRSTKVADSIFQLDQVANVTDITDDLPKSTTRSKKSFKNDGGVFKIKLIKNNNVIDMEYIYHDEFTIQNKIKSLVPQGKDNIELSSNEIYDKLEKYIENTLKTDDPEIHYTPEEINKYNSPYTKDNIKIYKENFYLSFHQMRRDNYESKTGWEEVKAPPIYICYNTINGNSDIPVNSSELIFVNSHIKFENQHSDTELNLNEKNAISIFMKYIKEYIFLNYSFKTDEISSESLPDSINSLIPKNDDPIIINDLLSQIENNNYYCLKMAFLDQNTTRYIILINDKQNLKSNVISLFIV